MTKTSFLAVFCLFSALSAFGQSKMGTTATMNREAAAQAWATAINLPPDTPGVQGGGLVIEPESNGSGKKVWTAFTQLGQYILVEKSCEGDSRKLGDLGWEPNPYSQVGGGMVLDTNTHSASKPYAPQICEVEMVRFGPGRPERSIVDVSPWQNAKAEFQITGEGVQKDRYYVSMGKLPDDAVVILGRQSVAVEIQRNLVGTVVYFNPTNLPSQLGPTTITVCSKGRCSPPTVYNRQVATEPQSGKG